MAIKDGSRLMCERPESHYVYLQLPGNPHEYEDLPTKSEVQSQLPLNF